MLTPTEIAHLLTRYLEPADAAARAQWVAADMAAVGFDLREDREVPPEQWKAMNARPQAEYVLPPTGFDLNGENADKAMAGSWLTRGNLLRLTHSVELGRKWLPGIWPGEFKHRLLGAEHLDTLNEVYWLKFWQGLKAVRPGPKANKAAPDTDWQITLEFGGVEQTVNLEVKRRTGNLNAWFKRGTSPVSLDKVQHKFRPGDVATLNVVALTVFKQPDLAAMDRLRKVVNESAVLDGAVIWVEDNFGGRPLAKMFKDGKKWAEVLVKEPNREDLMVAAWTAGTLCEKEGVHHYLDRLAAAQHLSVRGESGSCREMRGRQGRAPALPLPGKSGGYRL